MLKRSEERGEFKMQKISEIVVGVFVVVGGIFGVLVGFFGMIAAIVVVRSVPYGWAIKTLWGWFVVPAFGIPDITLPTAIGITFLLSVLLPRAGDEYASEKRKEEGRYAVIANMIAHLFLTPLIAVGLGKVLLLLTVGG
jgi:hypothetical protein